MGFQSHSGCHDFWTAPAPPSRWPGNWPGNSGPESFSCTSSNSGLVARVGEHFKLEPDTLLPAFREEAQQHLDEFLETCCADGPGGDQHGDRGHTLSGDCGDTAPGGRFDCHGGLWPERPGAHRGSFVALLKGGAALSGVVRALGEYKKKTRGRKARGFQRREARATCPCPPNPHNGPGKADLARLSRPVNFLFLFQRETTPEIDFDSDSLGRRLKISATSEAWEISRIWLRRCSDRR